MLACGLRRHEAVELNFGHIQQRKEHWAIIDLKGKAGHIRTIPMPAWVKNVLDQWLQAANITSGKLFRRVHKMGKTWGERLTEKSVWHVVREYATPLEALQTATINPARFLGKTLGLGTIAEGKLADMVLLTGNPLEDIRNTQKVDAVFVNGRPLDRKQLDSLLLQAENAVKNK